MPRFVGERFWAILFLFASRDRYHRAASKAGAGYRSTA
jgi:hypothetical protein